MKIAIFPIMGVFIVWNVGWGVLEMQILATIMWTLIMEWQI